MAKKLTLSMDEDLIKFAHSYSAKTRQSVSHLFEKYLQRLKKGMEHGVLSSEAKELHGILEKSELPDKKEMRRDFYEKSID